MLFEQGDTCRQLEHRLCANLRGQGARQRDQARIPTVVIIHARPVPQTGRAGKQQRARWYQRVGAVTSTITSLRRMNHGVIGPS